MTLTAVPLPQHQWPSAVRACFKHDAALLLRWHVLGPCTLNQAVADTCAALRAYTAPDFVLYGLREPGRPGFCGMVGVEPGSNFLVTFGLGLPFRTPEGSAELWRVCRNLCAAHRPVHCVLYQRNIPAQRFLLRHGFVASPEPLTHPHTLQPGTLFTLY